MRLTNQKGSVLIVLVIAMLMMSILGAGVYSLTTSSSFSQVLANDNDNAYELARAGIRYGVANNQSLTTQQTFYMPDSNHLFQVSVTNGIITATGIVNQGSFWEASRTLTYNVSWAPQSPTPGLITFQGDMPSFGAPDTGGNTPGSSIQANTGTNSLNLGGNVNNSYGSDWYQGSSIVGSCNNGACSFGAGLNVYFDFTFATQDPCAGSTCSADGFTFAVMSAVNNTRDRTGGAPPGYSAGELMGYAGPGNTSDGLGLKPPKMALQFDTYPNGAGNICSSGSRDDPSPFIDNVSLMFWGARSPSSSSEPSGESVPSGNTCPAANFTCVINGVSGQPCPDASFDDNVHGAGGTGTDPQNNTGPGDSTGAYYQFTNLYNGLGGCGNYGCTCSNMPANKCGGNGQPLCLSPAGTCNWMEDGYTYSARMEIVRPTLIDPDGTYHYQIKAWIVRQDLQGFSAVSTSHFKDVMVPFSDISAQINKTVKIYSQDHSDFSKIFFGFTEATGAATQQVTIANFEAFFPQSTCTSPTPTISPGGANFTAAGGSNSVSVTPSSTCPWMATSAANWITITSGSSGTSAGNLNYNVAVNNGVARTGYIDIAGANYTVNQSAVTSPTCTLTPGSSNVSYNTSTSLTWTVTDPTSASWASSPGGTCGPANLLTGGSCNTGSLNAPGTNTFTLNVSNSGGSNSCSATITVGCPTLSSITPTSLPNGTQGVAYTTTTLAASGGYGTLTWALAAGSLPPGLTFNTSTRTISGNPTAAGNYTFTISVTDQCPHSPQTNKQQYTITITSPPPTCTLTPGANIVAYNGTTGLTWTVTNSPTSATWTTSPGGTCGSPSASGGSCTTGGLTTPGANTYTLTVTNATGSNQCSSTVYVGCQGYRVWDNYNNTARPFLVAGGACVTGVTLGQEITNGTPQLHVGGTVTRYAGGAANCNGTASGSISYTQAMDANITANGHSGSCQVCYDPRVAGADTVGDRTGGTTCH